MVHCKQHKLAVLHDRFGLLSLSNLKFISQDDLILRELENVDPPIFPGCAQGKAYCKPWRIKGVNNRKKIKYATTHDQVVSIDQLISPTPVFVPTHRVTPTVKRYIGATVFVDRFSDFTYVQLITKLNDETNVKSKLEFERVFNGHGVCILRCHADNGLFGTKALKGSVTKSQQTLSFCGFNGHHQNVKAEQRIKDVTQGKGTSLLNAVH